MLRWPARAKRAIGKLFQPLQDVDVYVEDENDEVFYRALLQRLLDSRIRIARVVCLGGRAAVLDAAARYNDPARRALFVIDGDLEWLRDEPQPVANHLYRSDAYCIENFLICEYAVRAIVMQDAVLNEEQAIEALKWPDWVRGCEPLADLFAAYATLNKFAPEVPTVSAGFGGVLTQSSKRKPPRVARAKVATAIEDALVAAEGVVGRDVARKTYAEIRARIRALPNPIDAVSGKDFLLPLVNFHIQGLDCRVTRRALRMRLAAGCKLDRLSRLRAAVLAAAA